MPSWLSLLLQIALWSVMSGSPAGEADIWTVYTNANLRDVSNTAGPSTQPAALMDGATLVLAWREQVDASSAGRLYFARLTPGQVDEIPAQPLSDAAWLAAYDMAWPVLSREGGQVKLCGVGRAEQYRLLCWLWNSDTAAWQVYDPPRSLPSTGRLYLPLVTR
jgi:hypothetical protein